MSREQQRKTTKYGGNRKGCIIHQYHPLQMMFINKFGSPKYQFGGNWWDFDLGE